MQFSFLRKHAAIDLLFASNIIVIEIPTFRLAYITSTVVVSTYPSND